MTDRLTDRQTCQEGLDVGAEGLFILRLSPLPPFPPESWDREECLSFLGLSLPPDLVACWNDEVCQPRRGVSPRRVVV